MVCDAGATPARTATSPPANGGNCTIRGATRRRHAVVRLLMLQNPHHYPWRHAPSLVHGCPARPRWASGTVLTAGVATNLGEPRWRRNVTGSQLRDDVRARWGCPPLTGRMLPIRRSPSDQAQSFRSGAVLPMGRILYEERTRERASLTTPRSIMRGTEPRPARFSP